MKTIFILSLAAVVSAPAIADQYVNGHVRSDGTYDYRSTPNSVQYDNY